MIKGRNLKFGYDSHFLSWNVPSFDLRRGEIIGMTGGSGTGKSTFAQVLSGFHAYQGSLNIDDGKVGFLYQLPEYTFNPRWKVKKIIHHFSISDDLLKRFGVKNEWYDRYSYELSGGEIKKLSIASILRRENSYLILDELSSMLDPVSIENIWKEIIKLKTERNLGVLLIDHHPHYFKEDLDDFIRWN